MSEPESDIEEEEVGDEEVGDMEVDVPVFELTEAEKEIKTARANALKKIQEAGKDQGEGGESNDASRQLAYLMNQSEVFAHFLTDGDGDIPSNDKKKPHGKKERKSNRGGLGGGVGRTRMSEEAEDRRLMKLAQSKGGGDVSRVSEQPQTITGESGHLIDGSPV